MLEPAQEATLDAVLDRIMPADAHGPGALDLGVGRYLRDALASAYAADLPAYRGGLDALDARAREAYRVTFATLSPQLRDGLLLASETGAAGAEAATFFELVRRHAIEGLFADPAWGGNRDGGGWELIGYAGPRRAWSAEDQQLDATPARSRPDVSAPLPGAPGPR